MALCTPGTVELQADALAVVGDGGRYRAIGDDVRDAHIGARRLAEGDHVRVREPGADTERTGVVAGDHHRLGRRVGEPDEGVVERLLRAEVVEMVGVDVGDQCDRRVVEQEGAVGLIRLDHEQLTGAGGAGQAELLDHPAVDEVRVGSELPQGGDDHAGRGGLAVGAGHRHEPARSDQPVQSLGTMDDMQPALLRRQELRILRPDGAGVHDRVGIAEVRGVVPDVHRRSRSRERTEVVAVGSVGTGDADTGIEEHPRESAHAGTTDADEVGVGDGLGDREGEVGSDHVETSLDGPEPTSWRHRGHGRSA